MRRTIIILLILIFIGMFILSFMMYKYMHNIQNLYPDNITWVKYQVAAGDTLWMLVQRDNNYDIRDIIDLVEKHNNIDANIRIGQIIELPVW